MTMKRGPRKKKLPKLKISVDPSFIPPVQQTKENWMAIPLGDVKDACDTVGVAPEGTLEAIAGPLCMYYADFLTHQAIASAAQDNCFHPYTSMEIDQNTDLSIRQAIWEYEELLSRYNTVIDRVVHLQQLTDNPTASTSSFSAQLISFMSLLLVPAAGLLGATVASSWSSPATFNAVPSVMAPSS